MHPRTGSIFSPHHEELPSPLDGSNATELVAPERPIGEPHEASQPPAATLEPEPPRRITSRHTPLLPVSVSPEAHSIAQPPPLERESGVSPRDRAVVDDRERPWEPARNRLDVAADVRAAADVRDAENTPASFVKPAGLFDPNVLSAAARNPAHERHAARAERPDDIQIHIGRIEVIAVPPPAPRAPKAPDRSLSLDAYLSRRDGRSR